MRRRGSQRTELLSTGESNPREDKEKEIELLSSFDESNLKKKKRVPLELLSTGESDSIEDKVDRFKLFLSGEESNLKGGVVLPIQLLSRLAKISSSRKTVELLLYAVERRAFTALTAQAEMKDMTEATFYRCVKRLMANDMVVTPMKVPRGPRRSRGRGGPIPIIYSVVDYDPADLTEAVRRHNRFKSPKYREAHRVAQLILDEYIDMEASKPEIRFTQIMEVLKARLRRAQPDLADLVATDLHERGVAIWR